METLGCQPTAKKTLVNAVDKLSATADRFAKLAGLSERLVAKFERTEDQPTIKCDSKPPQDTRPPDIVDLFNDINTRLDNLLNRIGGNIEKVLDMID